MGGTRTAPRTGLWLEASVRQRGVGLSHLVERRGTVQVSSECGLNSSLTSSPSSRSLQPKNKQALVLGGGGAAAPRH